MAEAGTVNAPRVLPATVSWAYEFGSPVERVWPYAADTDRLDRAVGLPGVRFRHEARPEGGSRRFGEFVLGIGPIGVHFEWEEKPYEWERNRYFRVQRVYSRGPLRRMDVEFRFESTAGGCRLVQSSALEPRFAGMGWLLALQLRLVTRPAFLKAYRQIDVFLASGRTDVDELKPFPPTRGDAFRWQPLERDRWRRLLEGARVDPAQVVRLLQWIGEAQASELARIRPLRLAREWGMTRLSVVETFLRATNAGLFDLSWDLLCPSCRGPKQASETLSALPGQAHCDACNVTFDADFDRSVELTFRVSPAVRRCDEAAYCVGGPGRTRHYVLQRRLPPGGSATLSAPLPPGAYRLRSLQKDPSVEVEISGSSPGVSIAYPGTAGEVQSGSPLRLELGNSTAEEKVVILEKADWIEDACRASWVTSLQEFHDLFSSEVLRPGQEIAVRSTTLLFTDLKGSTALYRRVGDARAFSLVREHFDILIDSVRRHEGGLVKTIGDAVMAAFTSTESAVRAAVRIHRDIEEAVRVGRLKEHLQIKVGLHRGPCFVVNLNERLDYFGSAVNVAARTEGQCIGGDIVMTRNVLEEPGVGEYLRTENLVPQPFVRELKGFDEEFELFRVVCS